MSIRFVRTLRPALPSDECTAKTSAEASVRLEQKTALGSERVLNREPRGISLRDQNLAEEVSASALHSKSVVELVLRDQVHLDEKAT